MDFNFTEEQALLRDSIAKYAGAAYDFDKRRAMIQSAEGRDPQAWATFAELGLLAAPLPEAYGGLGGGPVDVLVVMEEFGKALVIEPYLETVALAGAALREGASEAQKGEHLAAIAAGERIIVPAFYEPKSRYNLADVAVTAKRQGAGFVLNGHKAVAIGAPWADWLLVSARTAGSQREQTGLTLFLVRKAQPGVSTRDYPTVDGRRAAEVYFENVPVGEEHVVGPVDAALPLIERAIDEATAALCAEAIGAMRVTHQLTVEYARARKQFGVPIGSFQVLQHRMVDMFMALEQAVSMTYMATLKLSSPDAERRKAVSSAKVQIGKSARFVGQSAVQIHGGMGVTDEMRVSHYFKRLSMIENQFGTVDHHLKRYMAAPSA